MAEQSEANGRAAQMLKWAAFLWPVVAALVTGLFTVQTRFYEQKEIILHEVGVRMEDFRREERLYQEERRTRQIQEWVRQEDLAIADLKRSVAVLEEDLKGAQGAKP